LCILVYRRTFLYERCTFKLLQYCHTLIFIVCIGLFSFYVLRIHTKGLQNAFRYNYRLESIVDPNGKLLQVPVELHTCMFSLQI
jgi:hypothetical protein